MPYRPSRESLRALRDLHKDSSFPISSMDIGCGPPRHTFSISFKHFRNSSSVIAPECLAETDLASYSFAISLMISPEALRHNVAVVFAFMGPLFHGNAMLPE